ncbi:hypothetical protein NT04LS_0012 [Listeria seeligeri FSL S4-171]|nr:hypothetical protein NT04LS_0012 [Listeria seeligeri FSL S4-171]
MDITKDGSTIKQLITPITCPIIFKNLIVTPLYFFLGI